MRNWMEAISETEKLGLITTIEAEDLRKLATKKISPKILKKITGGVTNTGKKIIDFLKNRENVVALFALSAITPTAYLAGQGMAKPFKSMIDYNRMKDQLERISPDILKKHDEKHIKEVWELVEHFSPIIASNPITAAISVRDNIMIPSTIDLSTIKTMTDIHKNVSGKESTDVVSGLSKNIFNASKNMAGVMNAANESKYDGIRESLDNIENQLSGNY
ncbi:MAG: hypothetical protein WCY30_00130 [Candidatus Neomarinimicrobiota bacterium]|jgi:hypothetical protein